MKPLVWSLLLSLVAPLAFVACGDSTSSDANQGGSAATSSTTSATTSTSAGSTSSDSTTTTTSSTSGGGGAGGAGDIDKSAGCTGTFGAALTNAYGRIDGTLLAIVKPEDQSCPMPNSTHVTLEVTMNGAVYRMVTNVLSDQGPPDVYFEEISHALPAPAWAEGWHTGITLDYVTDLGVHSTDATFTTVAEKPLANQITRDLTVGAKISVYATSSGGASAHLVHRNGAGADGAIVIDPDGASPKWMLFHFDEQTF